MSEKSLSIVLVSAAVVCGTFFLPNTPAPTPSARMQQAPLNSAAYSPATAQPADLVNVAMAKLDGSTLADSAVRHANAPQPVTDAFTTRMAVAAK